MRVAVVGGGINGVMSAWALALKGCSVDLFERGRLMGATSSASTKLLHGGLRYLEHGHLKLVREALHERRWWMMRAPHLAKPLQIRLPVYKESRRPGWMIWCGLALYDWLAGQASLGRAQWHSRDEVLRFCRDYLTDPPDELTVVPAVVRMPEGPLVAIVACYCGNPDVGAQLLRPLRSCGSLLSDGIRMMPYAIFKSRWNSTTLLWLQPIVRATSQKRLVMKRSI